MAKSRSMDDPDLMEISRQLDQIHRSLERFRRSIASRVCMAIIIAVLSLFLIGVALASLLTTDFGPAEWPAVSSR